MKKSLLILIATFAATAVLAATNHWQTVALWHMDGTVSAADKYGNTRSAVADDSQNVTRNDPLILGNRANPFDPSTVPTIASGGTLSFDGGDTAYAESAWEEQESLLLDFHCKPSTFAADAELFAVTSTFSIRLRTDGRIYAYVYDQQDGSVVSAISPPLALNQWSHVVVEVLDGTVEISLDGVAGSTATFSGDLQASHSPEIHVGSTWTGFRKFTGLIDEVRIDKMTHYEIEIPPITQSHPRLLINAGDVAAIQQAIASHTEPNYSAWLQLKARADAWSTNVVAAPYTGDDSLAFYEAACTAGHQASKMALAYLLEGDAVHAEKARDILLAWATATPLPATVFAEAKRFPSSGMDTSRGIVTMLYAYDYLYNYPGFSAAEKQSVETWFRAVLPSIQTGIDRWDAYYKTSATDPRGYTESTDPNDQYFGRQYYQNHLSAHTMGYLNIGYALGDPALVQFAVDSLENPRDYLELFEGTIMMDGDPVVYVGDTQNPPPQDGEIYDRYRHVQNNGLAYAHLTLSELTAMAETLFANGINLYSRRGTYGETLEHPFHFYADFWRTQDASIKGGFYSGETVPMGSYDGFIAIFEVANKRYPGNKEIEELLASVDRRQIDKGGDLGTYFCYPVLTHAAPLTGGVVSVDVFPDYRLKWDAALGRTYAVLRTTNLAATAWQPILSTNTDRGRMAFSDSQGPQFTNTFYRLTIE